MVVDLQGRKLSLKLERYANGRPAVLLVDGRLKFGSFSTNIPDLELEYEYFFVPLWNFESAQLAAVLATGAFVDTGLRSFGGAWNDRDNGPEAAVWRIVEPGFLAQLDAWIDEDMKAADALRSAVESASKSLRGSDHVAT